MSFNAIASRFKENVCRTYYTEAGETRQLKGEIVVDLVWNIIEEAIKQSGLDERDLDISEGVRIETSLEKCEVDLLVRYKNKNLIAIECKSYCDWSMFKRLTLESLFIQESHPDCKFLMFELESSIADRDLRTDKIRDILGPSIDTLTMLDGKRCSVKPIHDPAYFKPLSEHSYTKALNYFIDIFSELD